MNRLSHPSDRFDDMASPPISACSRRAFVVGKACDIVTLFYYNVAAHAPNCFSSSGEVTSSAFYIFAPSY